MTQIPRIFYKPTTQIWFYCILPVFFLGFVLLYRPESMVIFFSAGINWLPQNMSILAAILLATLAISRNTLFILRRVLHLNWLLYSAWSLMENIVAAFFMGLYITLISRGNFAYFPAVGYSLAFLLMVLAYPYIIITMTLAITYSDNEMADKDQHLMRFLDNTRKLKFVITSQAVLYIEAQANYVRIRYVDNDTVRDYVLRNSMRSIESMVLKHGMIRCQRSYYINPLHVKVLRKDKEGLISAELDINAQKPIPVSPKYYQDLTQALQ